MGSFYRTTCEDAKVAAFVKEAITIEEAGLEVGRRRSETEPPASASEKSAVDEGLQLVREVERARRHQLRHEHDGQFL